MTTDYVWKVLWYKHGLQNDSDGMTQKFWYSHQYNWLLLFITFVLLETNSLFKSFGVNNVQKYFYKICLEKQVWNFHVPTDRHVISWACFSPPFNLILLFYCFCINLQTFFSKMCRACFSYGACSCFIIFHSYS